MPREDHIGLNIHARSPEEIGISILAELIQVRRTSPVVIPQRRRDPLNGGRASLHRTVS
jgi:xanthine/CO dehydrogenase XdhC/CoxF family maturation factor